MPMLQPQTSTPWCNTAWSCDSWIHITRYSNNLNCCWCPGCLPRAPLVCQSRYPCTSHRQFDALWLAAITDSNVRWSLEYYSAGRIVDENSNGWECMQYGYSCMVSATGCRIRYGSIREYFDICDTCWKLQPCFRKVLVLSPRGSNRQMSHSFQKAVWNQTWCMSCQPSCVSCGRVAFKIEHTLALQHGPLPVNIGQPGFYLSQQSQGLWAQQ